MAILQWDQAGQRLYETGTNKGVLFVQQANGTYAAGVPWNGLISVKQANDGAEETPLFANNMKFLSLYSAENLKGSIEAYTYPTEFEVCDGSKAINPGIFVGQQTRTPFALAWSTIVGNDTLGNTYSEKIHVIWNAKVSPTERAYETVNDDPTALTFSWEFSTTPIDMSDRGLEPTAGIVFDKSKISTNGWKALQDKIYGTATLTSGMVTPQALIDIAKIA